jgi:hypothetical protein
VADDPVFGRFCFGGEIRDANASMHIIPRDGVRRRLRLRTAGQQIDLELAGGRFAKGQPIQWSVDQQRFLFTLETEITGSGEAQLLIAGLPTRNYKVICNQETNEFHPDATRSLRLRIPAGTSNTQVEIVRS